MIVSSSSLLEDGGAYHPRVRAGARPTGARFGTIGATMGVEEQRYREGATHRALQHV